MVVITVFDLFRLALKNSHLLWFNFRKTSIRDGTQNLFYIGHARTTFCNVILDQPVITEANTTGTSLNVILHNLKYNLFIVCISR